MPVSQKPRKRRARKHTYNYYNKEKNMLTRGRQSPMGITPKWDFVSTIDCIYKLSEEGYKVLDYCYGLFRCKQHPTITVVKRFRYTTVKHEQIK